MSQGIRYMLASVGIELPEDEIAWIAKQEHPQAIVLALIEGRLRSERFSTSMEYLQAIAAVSGAEHLSPVRAYLAGQVSWKEMEGEIRELSDQEDALRMVASDLVKNIARAPSLDACRAFCKQHDHSWIKPEYSSHRRCSYCGEYKTPEGLLEDFRIEKQATLGTATLSGADEDEG